MVLVLLRHGESEWNAKDLFAGWTDVPPERLAAAAASDGVCASVRPTLA